jgi:Zn-dependent M16 (insulinase) family peptidase
MEKKNVHGFILEEETNLPELKAKTYRLTHEKTGADVLFIQNEDKNRVFGIGFTTPQDNSTGVPHIIEHCVLNGSRKYKTKEPFMDLARSSLATFLNAMTFSDKTIYPIASRNEQDYRNLMDVYLDAVFYPGLYEDERVFRQEGWRYQITAKDEPMTYSGVVYNEMRGAYSSPLDVLYRSMEKNLFPDTHYANDSGGDPYVIPELTYEGFKNFHKRYYSPSNAKIFFYGDLDLDYYLYYLNDDYLSHFDRIDVDTSIKTQAPFEGLRKVHDYYSLSKDEDPTDKDYLGLGYVVTDYTNLKESLMLDVVVDALFDSPTAPVRLALEEAGLAQDVSAFSDHVNQGYMALLLQNTGSGAVDKLVPLVEKTLQDLVDHKIDRKLLEASLNRIEYSLREGGSFPTKGILYFIKVFESWNYGADPLDSLRYEDILARTRESLETDLWEKFIEEKFLKNPHKLLLHLEAKPGLNAEKDQKVLDKLQAYKTSLTDEELEQLIQKNLDLAAWQSQADTAEAKATIPQLSLEDINQDLPNPPCELKQEGHDLILRHPIFTSDISYGLLSFPLDHIDLEDFFYVQFLADSLGLVDTENYSYKDLGVAVYLASGGIQVSPALYRDKEKQIKAVMEVSWKTLPEEEATWPDLVYEIIAGSKFTDEKRLLDLIRMQLVNLEQAILGRGDNYAFTRALSHVSLSYAMSDAMGGVAYYLRLKQLRDNFETEKENFIRKLTAIYQLIFSRGGVVASLTTEGESLDQLEALTSQLLTKLEWAEKKPVERTFEALKVSEGIQASSNVQYVVKAFDYEKLGYDYNGQFEVLSLILGRDFLHNQIRAAGGAYGNSLSIRSNGGIGATSYRDPHLERSLEVYDRMGQWLRDQNLSQDEIDQYIIGSVNRFDPPVTPAALGKLAYVRYLTGKTVEDQKAYLEQAMATTEDSIKAYADLLDKAMEEKLICVIGNSDKVKASQDVFDRMLSL